MLRIIKKLAFITLAIVLIAVELVNKHDKEAFMITSNVNRYDNGQRTNAKKPWAIRLAICIGRQ